MARITAREEAQEHAYRANLLESAAEPVKAEAALDLDTLQADNDGSAEVVALVLTKKYLGMSVFESWVKGLRASLAIVEKIEAAKALQERADACRAKAQPSCLNLRKTYRYNGENKHLDEWLSLGTYYVQHEEHYSLGEDMTEPMRHEYLVRVDLDMLREGETVAAATEKEIVQALHDVYTAEGCSCEGDCCGHRSYRVVDVRRDDYPDTFRVYVNSSRNF